MLALSYAYLKLWSTDFHHFRYNGGNDIESGKMIKFLSNFIIQARAMRVVASRGVEND